MKIHALLMTAMLAAASVILPTQKVGANTPSKEYTVCTNTNPLNLRTRPTTRGKIITQLAKSSRVSYEGDATENGQWVYISQNGTFGWSYSKWLCEVYVTPTNTTPIATVDVCTNTSPLNIRATPNGKVLGSSPKGSKVEFIQANSDGSWFYIQKGNIKGWSYAKYLCNYQTVLVDAKKTPSSNSKVCSQYNVAILRSNPSLTSQVVNGVNNGSMVNVYLQQGPWVYIRQSGIDGWIHESNLCT